MLSKFFYKWKISKSTINNYLRNIKVFFNFLDEYDMIRKNPVTKVKQLRNPRKAKDFINDREFNNLIKCLDLIKFSEYRDYTLIQVIIDTGMRLGECLMLKMEDIDLNERCSIQRMDTHIHSLKDCLNRPRMKIRGLIAPM